MGNTLGIAYSLLLSGQEHRWRLNALFQKGWGRSRKNLRRALSLALELIICIARSRFDGKHFSLRQTGRALWKLPREAVDWVLGWPRRRGLASSAEALKKAETDHLLRGIQATKLEPFFNFVAQALNKYYGPSDWTREGELSFDQDDISNIHLVYKYHFKDVECDWDVSLCHGGVWREAEERLSALLVELGRDTAWLYQQRDRIVDQLQSEGASEEMVWKGERALRDVFVERVVKAVLADPELRAVVPQVPGLLVANLRLSELVLRAREDLGRERREHELKTREGLEKAHPIRAGIKRWLSKQMRRAMAAYDEANAWRPQELILKRAAGIEGLEAFVLLLDRHTQFHATIRDKLLAEMDTLSEPDRVFNWRQRIWSPSHYVVTRHEGRERTIVYPVQFSQEPLLPNNRGRGNPHRPHYTLEKTVTRHSSNGYLGWRWVNFGFRYWTWLCNALFYTLIHGPWRSGWGARSLFSPTAFYPKLKLDTDTGVLHTDFDAKKPSFVSRIRSLWKHIRNARAGFEAAPDRGFLSKSATRPLNVLWNHGVKGVLGTTLLVLLLPVTYTFFLLGCFTLALTSPLWVFLAVIGKHLFCLLIYDVDGVKGNENYAYLFKILIFRLLIQGIVQPVAAVFTAVVLCPLGSLLVTLGGGLRFGLRSWWDGVMYAVLVKPFARLPSTDSWVARRIAGPGLSSHFFYQMLPEQALMMLQRRIELDELEAFESSLLQRIGEPLQLFRHRLSSLFAHLSLSVNENSDLMAELKKDDAFLRTRARQAVSGRRSKLGMGLSGEVRHHIRMTRENLHTVLSAGAAMLQAEYPRRVLSLLAGEEEVSDFWSRRELREGDWEGLAKQLLSDLLSEEITQPLEDGEARFKLHVDHVDFGSYIGQLLSGEHREDLEAAAATQAARANSVVPLPPPLLPHAFRFNTQALAITYPYASVGGWKESLVLPPLWEVMLAAYGGEWTEMLHHPRGLRAVEKLQRQIALRDLAAPLPHHLF